VSTNITTTYGAKGNGAGKVTARATVNGKSKQKTVTYDHERTAAQNHGDACGAMLRDLVKPDRRNFVAATARHADLGNGKMRFTVSL
jgi:hypothetical protein